MPPDCPECERDLRVRGPNLLKNLRRRQVEDIHDKYVCPNCETTFSREEVVDREDKNISMIEWMDTDVTEPTMNTKQREAVENAIVALNRAKITRFDEELLKDVNNLQRKLEQFAGKTAVELDEKYD